MRIHLASLLDLAALQSIGQQTFTETFAEGNTAENLARYLTEGFSDEKLTAELENENSQFYLAEKEDKVLGYLKVNTGDAQSEKQDPAALEIERIYVLQEYQGKEVGMKLYEQALSIALNRNAPYLAWGLGKESTCHSLLPKAGFCGIRSTHFPVGGRCADRYFDEKGHFTNKLII